MIKGGDEPPKDVQGCGHLLKEIILPLNEVFAQSLSKERVSPPEKQIITPLLKDMGPTS